MCSWVITAPVGLVTDIEYGADEKPRLSFEGNEDELKLFFHEAYKFLNKRYAAGSERNVISAHIHMAKPANVSTVYSKIIRLGRGPFLIDFAVYVHLRVL